jgi:CarD family transcriptional regulator
MHGLSLLWLHSTEGEYTTMFSINDYVVYSTSGVCQIIDRKRANFGTTGEQEYYVLKPLSSNSLIYVSTTNESSMASMRPTMTDDEILELLHSLPERASAWPANEHKRHDIFVAKLQSGSGHELARLITCLHREQKRKSEAGKKLHVSDAKVMAVAEKLLHEEIAFVMGIKMEDVVPFIRERIQPN